MTVRWHTTKSVAHKYGGKKFSIEQRLTFGPGGKFAMTNEDRAAYEKAILRAKRAGLDLPSPNMIKFIRKKALRLTQREMAKLVGGGERSFQKYESGYSLPSRAVSNLLRLLHHDPELAQVLQKTSWPH